MSSPPQMNWGGFFLAYLWFMIKVSFVSVAVVLITCLVAKYEGIDINKSFEVHIQIIRPK